jgi:hypothetical protein
VFDAMSRERIMQVTTIVRTQEAFYQREFKRGELWAVTRSTVLPVIPVNEDVTHFMDDDEFAP